MLAEMIRGGSLRVPVHRTFPLAEVHAAVNEAAAENRGGKVLLDLTAD